MSCRRIRIRPLIAVLAIAVCSLGVVGAVRAEPPEVRDDAGFFTPAVVSQANARILYLKRLFKKDLQIESFKEVPASRRAAIEADRQTGFREWAAGQAKSEKVDGILVLICKQPTYLDVYVTESAKKAFSGSDGDKLVKSLIGSFKEKKFDAGLIAATDFVRSRFVQNLGVPVADRVGDHAGVFSTTQIGKADAEILEFKNRFKKDLVIETFKTPPPDKQKLLATASPREKNKIFGDWVDERVKNSKTDGIYVLICMNPPHLQVGTTNDVAAKMFPPKDRDGLVDMMVSHMRNKTYNEGLDETLDYIYDAVDRNVSPPLPAPTREGVADRGICSATPPSRMQRPSSRNRADSGPKIAIETIPVCASGRGQAPGSAERRRPPQEVRRSGGRAPRRRRRPGSMSSSARTRRPSRRPSAMIRRE